MRTKLNAPAGLTAEDLQRKAAAKFKEAAALPAGRDQQKLLISGNVFLHAAEVRAGFAYLRTPK
jgi:hypothetical protein